MSKKYHRTFNKTAVQAKINLDLKSSGLRPISEIVFQPHNEHEDPRENTLMSCAVIGYFYTGEARSTRQTIYGLGCSKRSMKDQPNSYEAHMRALQRAVSSYTARQRALGVKLEPRKSRKQKRAEHAHPENQIPGFVEIEPGVYEPVGRPGMRVDASAFENLPEYQTQPEFGKVGEANADAFSNMVSKMDSETGEVLIEPAFESASAGAAQVQTNTL